MITILPGFQLTHENSRINRRFFLPLRKKYADLFYLCLIFSDILMKIPLSPSIYLSQKSIVPFSDRKFSSDRNNTFYFIVISILRMIFGLNYIIDYWEIYKKWDWFESVRHLKLKNCPYLRLYFKTTNTKYYSNLQMKISWQYNSRECKHITMSF